MAKGQWTRYGRGLCEGYNIELGEVYRCSVSRHDDVRGGPTTWRTRVNLVEKVFPDRDTAMRDVEFEIEQGMKRLNEDWAIYQANKLLNQRKGKKPF